MRKLAVTNIIAVGGENLIDLVEKKQEDHLPHYIAHPGGGPYNIAMAAGRQGGGVVYLTPISVDRLGQMLAQNLIDSHVELLGPRVSLPTSLAIVSIKDDKPSFQFYRDDTAERNVTREMLATILDDNPWVFHIGSLALASGEDAEAWEEYFMAMHEKGVVTSLDPNVRPNLIPDRDSYIRRLERMIACADILKLSDEDLLWLYPDQTSEEAFEHICALSGDGVKVMTKGADGAFAKSNSAEQTITSIPLEMLADTVGAGDTFMATMLVWLRDNNVLTREDINQLNENQLKALLQKASLAAGLNCMKYGCNPPTSDEIAAYSKDEILG